MSTNSGAIETSSDAALSTELPSNGDADLSNEVKLAVAVGDDLLESNTGTLKLSSDHDGGGTGTADHDPVVEARVSGDENEIVMENVEKVTEVNDEEKEGEYKVSDLVWAKVRNYPWWPGQIFDPSASSDVAKKHSNKKGFLIAYFGDQSFAWNEKSKIKPFRKNCFKMEKQSTSHKFLHAVDCALDEALRRIEFGLSCSCLSKEVYDVIKSKTFVNAGISKEASTIQGGDNFSTVNTFKPGNIVQSVQALAREDSFDGFNRLQVMSLHTQLFSYYRWKGYHQFSTRYFLEGSDEKSEDKSEVPLIEKPEDKSEVPLIEKPEDKSEVPLIEKQDSVDEKVSSKKRKNRDKSKDSLMEKGKKMVSVSEKVSKKRKLDDSDSVSLKKHKKVLNGDMGKKKEKVLTKVTSNGSSRKENGGKSGIGIAIPSPKKRLFGVGASICKIAKQLSVSPLIPKKESEFQFQRLKDSNSVDEKCFDLSDESTESDAKSVSSDSSEEKLAKKESKFRRLKDSNSFDEKHVDQTEESIKSMKKSLTSDSSMKKSKEKSAKKESRFRRSKESNSVDEMDVDQTEKSTKSETKSVTIDSSIKKRKKKSEKKSVTIDSSLKTSKKKSFKKELQFQRSKKSNSIDENRVDQTEESNKSEAKALTSDSILKTNKKKSAKKESGFRRSKESNSIDEKHVDQTEESTKSDNSTKSETKSMTSDSSPKTEENFTALILKFISLDSIPSITELNEIFSKYGNVRESETEVLRKSVCAKIVFEEKSTAESAFSSAGKFSIFGPSLISYRLDYSPTPRKIYTRKGKKKME